MVRILGRVDGFGDNGTPISGRQTFRSVAVVEIA
jgi:hypothetical protein